MRPLLPLATLCALSLPAPARADGELTPEKMAIIQHDEQKALDKVNEAHGNKKSSEMDGDERRAVIQEQAAAEQEVLDKHQVDPKEYATRNAKLSREERAQVAQAAKALEEKEAAEKRAAAEKAAAEKQPAANPDEVVVRRGYGEDQPVDVSDTDEQPAADEPGLRDDPAAGTPGAGGDEPGSPPNSPPGKKKRHGKKHHAE